MMFFTVIMIGAWTSVAWARLQCPKCVTTIAFDQSIEVPVTCGQIAGDYCAVDITMDFHLSEIQLDFDSQTMDSANDSLFNRSISYTNYFLFETPNLRINMDIACSTSDRCAFELGEQQIRQILDEIGSAAVWMDVLSTLRDILLASTGSVSLDQCYKPKDVRDVCQANSSNCYVDQILPMKDKPEQWLSRNGRQDPTRWDAGCSSDDTRRNRLIVGYSMYGNSRFITSSNEIRSLLFPRMKPTSTRNPDYIIFAANCNKTLCNGGGSRANVVRLLGKYPTVGGWYDVPSHSSHSSFRPDHSPMLLVMLGLFLNYFYG